MQENEPKFLQSLKRYSLWFGAGAIAALQALRTELLSFPPPWKIYLGYFFSLITLFCVFLAGSSVLDLIKKWNSLISAMKDKKEVQDEVKEIDEKPH